MKTKRSLIQIWLLCAAMLPAVVQAQFTFTTNNGAITITGYTGTNSIVVIPSTTNGLPVTGIGSQAFEGRGNLISVTIPDGVTNIGISAFEYCSKLTNVTIPARVISIAQFAFASCNSLTNVMIPTSVTSIGIAAFASCSNLTAITADVSNAVYSSSVDGVLFNKSQTKLIEFPSGKAGNYTIPNSVITIGSYAFYGSANLIGVIIPNTVTNILDETFESCASLVSVPIPDSVTGIGGYSFYSCTSLTNVTISKKVISIGTGAFAACTDLTAITSDASNAIYSSIDGVLFDKNVSTLIQYPAGKAGSYTVPDSVTNIGVDAFDTCFRLSGVTIPDSVTALGDFAFNNCTSLTNVLIPDSVTNMGSNAFDYCARLNSVSIGNGVSNIGDFAFGYCTNLTCVKLGSAISNISYAAFYHCTKLSKLTIPKGVATIEWFAFSYCYNLTAIYFQGNAPVFDSDVFDGDIPPRIYYLPGTTGWSSTVDNLPAILWNPQTQTVSGSLGVQSNQFGFTITGTTNIPIVVEACINLGSGAWIPLQSVNLTNGSFYFSDPQWTNYPGRFYRIRSP